MAIFKKKNETASNGLHSESFLSPWIGGIIYANTSNKMISSVVINGLNEAVFESRKSENSLKALRCTSRLRF